MSLANGEFVIAPEHLLELDLAGTRWLLFRDIPDLIKKYVSGTVALDYGCGTGTSTRFLKSCGLHAEGVDNRELMVTSAKKFDPAGTYSVIKSGEIPANGNHYDLILASAVFPYVSNKNELQLIMHEISRCLKTGGVFIASVPNEHTYQNDWITMDGRLKENANLYSGGVAKVFLKKSKLVVDNYYWTEDDYRELLEKAKLKLACIHRPLGNDLDECEWRMERHVPFCDIYVARKDA